MKPGRWELQTQEGEPVTLPPKTKTFRGEPVTVTGGSPPASEGSTGRIYVNEGIRQGEYFPSVCDLKWIIV